MLPSRPPPIPLNSTRTEIFFQIREKRLLKAPNPMKTRYERRNKRRYCRFHREHAHDTEECRDLQSQIEPSSGTGTCTAMFATNLRSLIIGPLETRHPDQRGRLRNKSTLSSGGRPRAPTAPWHARFMHALRLERGLRMKKTLTSPSGRRTKSTPAMTTLW
ncbi:hypothetical protein BHM03_00000252 [Ensete ventricosum]|nr:hypothetical protein BHM03_00000252 [Ensete ventricosum]